VPENIVGEIKSNAPPSLPHLFQSRNNDPTSKDAAF